MASLLADNNITITMAEKKVEKAERAVHKATAVLAASPSDRHLKEKVDAAMRAHAVANTALMATYRVASELLLHQVAESAAQTDDILIGS
jgi:hypothetical protein